MPLSCVYNFLPRDISYGNKNVVFKRFQIKGLNFVYQNCWHSVKNASLGKFNTAFHWNTPSFWFNRMNVFLMDNN